ncbi:hypothetical protein C8F01DRAFT_145350 [Mycena amicta]|nr:hypothetical protein C8F01DRAFT_145350 [Mycena amicta]
MSTTTEYSVPSGLRTVNRSGTGWLDIAEMGETSGSSGSRPRPVGAANMTQENIEMGPLSAMDWYPGPIYANPPPTPGPRRRIKITPWRLLNTTVLLGFGISKTVLSFRGETTAPNILDWALGVLWGLIAYWGSIVEAETPEDFPWLFGHDLSRPLSYVLWLAFLCFFVVLYFMATFFSVISLADELAKTDMYQSASSHTAAFTCAILAVTIATCLGFLGLIWLVLSVGAQIRQRRLLQKLYTAVHTFFPTFFKFPTF